MCILRGVSESSSTLNESGPAGLSSGAPLKGLIAGDAGESRGEGEGEGEGGIGAAPEGSPPSASSSTWIRLLPARWRHV
jgi:hypothetical protein